MTTPDGKASRLDRLLLRIKRSSSPSGSGSASNAPNLVSNKKGSKETATAESMAPVLQEHPTAKTITDAGTTATVIEEVHTDDAAGHAPSHATEVAAEPNVSTEAATDVAEAVSAELEYKPRAPKWNEALAKFKQENPKRYDALERVTQGSIANVKQLTELKLPKSITENPQSHEIVQRMRKYLPSLAAVKGVLMPVASHDPYKLAPILCALSFGIIEVSENLVIY